MRYNKIMGDRPDNLPTSIPLGSDLLRMLIDLLPDAIYVKDIQGRYVLDNTAHLRAVGKKSSAEVIGKTVREMFPRELAAKYEADDAKVLNSGQALLAREERHLDDHGRQRWMNTSKVPLRDSNGKIVGLVCIS